MNYKRITKRAAQKRFYDGDKPIYLCPCKFYPSGSWNMACLVFGKEYLEKAEQYRDNWKDSPVWKGDINTTAWEIMYNNWAFYNTSYETGYYAHYYIEEANHESMA